MSENSPNSVWNILSSIRLTLVLLIILAITSIFGTLIPQQEASVEFAQRLSPGLSSFLSSLQIFDMYHSVWFRLIIFCLVLNLVVCSINRFPATLKLFRLTPSPDKTKPFEGLPPQRTITREGSLKEIAEGVMMLLRKRYRNVMVKDADQASFFSCEKGRFTIFGVYLVHLSVLFILIGAMIGSLFGFNAYVNILEGESEDRVFLMNSAGNNYRELGFSVRCEKFFYETYDNGMPKEYRSDLSFIVDSETVQRSSLLVNHPVTFRGVTFYQSSYGFSTGRKARLRISAAGESPGDSILEAELGRPVPLPGDNAKLILHDIQENFMNMGPAVLIVIIPGEGEEISLWIFKNREMIENELPGIFEKYAIFNPSAYRPYNFYLDNIEPGYYTGLQVNRDPGVPLVYAGFYMIIIGLFLTFFASHRRVWVRVTEKSGKIMISVAGKANKNPVGMEKELDHLVTSLSQYLNTERKI
ncbi:MAG TPA: cytochrome c biogenesis protein ResB [Desulfatiglandales bacterium]|nr:cytochrome c biogenesis protein ResB [Desulfatiglandales bacterium]